MCGQKLGEFEVDRVEGLPSYPLELRVGVGVVLGLSCLPRVVDIVRHGLGDKILLEFLS